MHAVAARVRRPAAAWPAPGQEVSQAQRILETYPGGGTAMVPPNRDCGEGVLAGVERSVAGFTVSVGTGPGESGGLDEHVVAFCPARSALGQRLKMPGSLPGSFSWSVRIGPPGARSARCTWPGMAARADKERSRAAGCDQVTGTGAGLLHEGHGS